jgi:hypothetical protein
MEKKTKNPKDVFHVINRSQSPGWLPDELEMSLSANGNIRIRHESIAIEKHDMSIIGSLPRRPIVILRFSKGT